MFVVVLMMMVTVLVMPVVFVMAVSALPVMVLVFHNIGFLTAAKLWYPRCNPVATFHLPPAGLVASLEIFAIFTV